MESSFLYKGNEIYDNSHKIFTKPRNVITHARSDNLPVLKSSVQYRIIVKALRFIWGAAKEIYLVHCKNFVCLCLSGTHILLKIIGNPKT